MNVLPQVVLTETDVSLVVHHFQAGPHTIMSQPGKITVNFLNMKWWQFFRQQDIHQTIRYILEHRSANVSFSWLYGFDRNEYLYMNDIHYKLACDSGQCPLGIVASARLTLVVVYDLLRLLFMKL